MRALAAPLSLPSARVAGLTALALICFAANSLLDDDALARVLDAVDVLERLTAAEGADPVSRAPQP